MAIFIITLYQPKWVIENEHLIKYCLVVKNRILESNKILEFPKSVKIAKYWNKNKSLNKIFTNITNFFLRPTYLLNTFHYNKKMCFAIRAIYFLKLYSTENIQIYYISCSRTTQPCTFKHLMVQQRIFKIWSTRLHIWY